jgi:diaminohydroxyphosphoribosylaminopyrimidine deaminase/5-amino-6-(5-phosphoribosylamino)uracil reductase
MKDPHPLVAGGGFADLEAAGVTVDVHTLPAAAALNEGYVSRITTGRPFVRLKVASSLDARTAMASGESQWITGPAARAEVQYWRARSCAIITGSATVLADDPQLNVRDGRFAVAKQIRQPLRVVVDSKLRIPKTAAVFKKPGRCLLAHAQGAVPKIEDCEHFCAGTDKVDLAALLTHLGSLECNEVMVESGPTLLGGFVEAGLWDELIVYQAPKLLGSDARGLLELSLTRMDQAIEATITDYTSVGDDLRICVRPG